MDEAFQTVAREDFARSPVTTPGCLGEEISGMVSYRGAAARGTGAAAHRAAVQEEPGRASSGAREETTMTEYLITFNDEWVPPLTAEEIRQKSVASRAVIAEMQAQDVLIFSNGGL